MRTGRAPLLTALALGLLLLGACEDETKRTLTPPTTPDYLANDSPDNVVANLVMAWEAMDAEGYAALLYDGLELATDGQAYAPYKFYFADEPYGYPLPDTLSYAEELACTGALLGGEPGIDPNGDPVPGLKSLAMQLTGYTAWTSVAEGDVESDPCPEDILRRSHHSTVLITLTEMTEYGINAFYVQDLATLHCIPVQVGAETEYRLWKWTDVVSLGRAEPARGSRTEETSLGQVKSLFLAP